MLLCPTLKDHVGGLDIMNLLAVPAEFELFGSSSSQAWCLISLPSVSERGLSGLFDNLIYFDVEQKV